VAALAIAEAAQRHGGPIVVVTPGVHESNALESELAFFGGEALPVFQFPDWETLPYDQFSPHQDIISQRLRTLDRLPQTREGVLVVPIATLMQRVVPPDYLAGHVLDLGAGEQVVHRGVHIGRLAQTHGADLPLALPEGPVVEEEHVVVLAQEEHRGQHIALVGRVAVADHHRRVGPVGRRGGQEPAGKLQPVLGLERHRLVRDAQFVGRGPAGVPGRVGGHVELEQGQEQHHGQDHEPDAPPEVHTGPTGP
jgi:hypothetical protein